MLQQYIYIKLYNVAIRKWKKKKKFVSERVRRKIMHLQQPHPPTPQKKKEYRRIDWMGHLLQRNP